MSQPQEVSAEKLLETCLEACEDRKAIDVQAYDLRGQSVMADYLVICSGSSTPQLQAIQASVDKALKSIGIFPKNVEGKSGSHADSDGSVTFETFAPRDSKVATAWFMASIVASLARASVS